MKKFTLTITCESVEEFADVAAALEEIEARRSKILVTEILAGAELDRTLSDADANRPLGASIDQLMGREPFLPRAECERLRETEEAKLVQAVKDAVLPNPFEEKAGPTFSAGIYEARPNTTLEGKPIFVYKASAGDYYLSKVYSGGVFTYLGAAGRYTAPELRRADQSQFGQETGICGICARELTDPESIAAGFGPVCRGK